MGVHADGWSARHRLSRVAATRSGSSTVRGGLRGFGTSRACSRASTTLRGQGLPVLGRERTATGHDATRPTLAAALAELGHVPTESELRTWLRPVLNAISVLHEGGVWHQNIAPDEILLTPVGPVLLGFASAAHAIEEVRHVPAAALKPGFAAIEQYGSTAGTTRGPWTDLYSLAAVIYAAITGSEPAAATDRRSTNRSSSWPSSPPALQRRLPRRGRCGDARAAGEPAPRPHRVPGPDGRHRGARGTGLAGAAPRPDAGTFTACAPTIASDRSDRPCWRRRSRPLPPRPTRTSPGPGRPPPARCATAAACPWGVSARRRPGPVSPRRRRLGKRALTAGRRLLLSCRRGPWGPVLHATGVHGAPPPRRRLARRRIRAARRRRPWRCRSLLPWSRR